MTARGLIVACHSTYFTQSHLFLTTGLIYFILHSAIGRMASLDWLKNRSKPTETECYELGPERPLPIVSAASAPLPSTSTKRPGEDAEFILGRNDPKLAYKVFSESIAKGAFGAISNDMTHTAKSASQGAVFMPFETPQEKLVKVQHLVNALEKEINANDTATPTDVCSAISSLNTQLSLISAQIQEATSQEGISTPKPAVTHIPLAAPPPSLPSPSTSSLASVEQRLHKLERLIGVLTPSSSGTGITDISTSLLSALRILSVLQAGSGPTVDAAVARLRVLEANIDTFSKGSAEEVGKLTEAWDRLTAAEAAAEAVQDTVTR